ncbi:Sensor histidine kinase TodS [Ensifer adhaerens]|uniref:sensor histidine kinase n=1 Tax=Ensifer adhaerens TaxID=106592 RepID=UPI00156846DD|nr:sensor histidine kinase [Ensifer adhaerens]NRP19279.1 Sensor histidine kinase TodS [Ensifer adhaerens]
MTEELYFHADAAIINRLGRELVAKQETALIELIKNAYDADANKVTVSFFGREGPSAALEIQDDGEGMNRSDMLDGFLRLASDLKVQNPTSPKYRRARAGRKGIGRFSTQRLGDRLTLTTQTRDAMIGLQLVADWTQFKPGKQLGDVVVTLTEVPLSRQGTTLRIEGLHDQWTLAQIRSCWRSVLALQQPFPVRPIEARSDSNIKSLDPGFEVQFLDGGSLFDHATVIADMQSEILAHLPVIIELRVDEDGFAKWRVSKNAFGPKRDWRPIHHDHRHASDPPPYSSLRNVAMKAYHVILDPSLLPSLVFTRVRDTLGKEGGIRLYRNGFRVPPYGEPGNDWLRLDENYSRRNVLAPITNKNFFGVIEVQDPEGLVFEEHTSREGLIETPAFSELKDVTSASLITAATEIQSDRGRKTHTSAPSPRPETTAVLSEARAAMRAAREAIERTTDSSNSPEKQQAIIKAADAERIIEAEEKRIVSERALLADEAAMLRLLSSIGMTTAEFSHETGMAFEAFRLDLERVFETALAARPGDSNFRDQAERASQALMRLDTLTAYLNATVASRAMREIHPVSLSKAVEDFAKGMTTHAGSQSATIEVETPALDALYTKPMHEAEVASILLNLYTNALKAMKRASGPRRIRVVADRSDDKDAVRLQFCDTGDGVPENVRTRIFDAFFTTQSAAATSAPDVELAKGTGLGLWIVDQIVKNAGGEISVSDAPPGYSTCFELRIPTEVPND